MYEVINIPVILLILTLRNSEKSLMKSGADDLVVEDIFKLEESTISIHGFRFAKKRRTHVS
jgi:hypothetical protein